MITEILLENFKAFGNEQALNIKPITLIYGENSSGKSSILNALLLLKQTYEESASPNTALLYKGTLTDQQNYSRCVNERDSKKSIKIGLKCAADLTKINNIEIRHAADRTLLPLKKEEYQYIEECIDKILIKSNYIDSGMLESLDYHYQGEIFCRLVKIPNKENILRQTIEHSEKNWSRKEFEYKDKIPDEFLYEKYECESEFLYEIEMDAKCPLDVRDLDIYKIDNEIISREIILYLCNSFPSSNLTTDNIGNLVFFVRNGIPVYFAAIDWDSKSAISQTFNFLPSCIILVSALCKQNLINLRYLGALRRRPERFAEFLKDSHASVGIDGQHVAAVLYDNPLLLNYVNKTMCELGLKYEISVLRLSGEHEFSFGNIFSIQVIEKETGVPLTLCDVGFGLSQILPILVQSIIPGHGAILIEQPEIHLHPKMQAELGDFFIRQVKSDQPKQFVIETHSENILLRIMRRIRETTRKTIEDPQLAITTADVCVLYVEAINGKSIIREMPLNEYGELTRPWPGGFFEEGFREMF